MTKKLLEKQTESAKSSQSFNPQTPSLFETIRRKKQNEEQQPNTNIPSKISKLSNDLKNNSNIKNVQDPTQVTNSEILISRKATTQDKDKQTLRQNNHSTNSSTSENNSNNSILTTSALTDTKVLSNKFDGKYVAAVKSNLEQNCKENTSSRGTTNLSETRNIGNRDLYIYYTEDGLQRFGRSEQNILQAILQMVQVKS